MSDHETVRQESCNAHRLIWEYGGVRYSAWLRTREMAETMQRQLREEYGVTAEMNVLALQASTTIPGVTVIGHASGTR